MKNTFLLIAILAILTTSCNKKEKSKSLNYSGSNTVTIALRDNYQINADSDYDISYSTSNSNVVTVSQNGLIYGKNVGQAQVTFTNSYESRTVDVNVDLFVEPTFEFGCNTQRIKNLYGSPYNSGNTSSGLLVYQYTQKTDYGYYSYACGEMDFFFSSGAYVEADLYIREGLDALLNNYIDENFILYDTVQQIAHNNDTVDCYLYRNKIDPTVTMGKFQSGNQYNETILYYYQPDNDVKWTPRLERLR